MKHFVLIILILTSLNCFAQYDSIHQSTTYANLCEEIITKIDKFDGTITHSSPLTSNLIITRSEVEGKSYFFITKAIPGDYYLQEPEGFYILLEGGHRILKKDAKVTVRKLNDEYLYVAFLELNAPDIALLIENKITDTRVYIFEESTERYDGILIREYLKCLLKK